MSAGTGSTCEPETHTVVPAPVNTSTWTRSHAYIWAHRGKARACFHTSTCPGVARTRVLRVTCVQLSEDDPLQDGHQRRASALRRQLCLCTCPNLYTCHCMSRSPCGSSSVLNREASLWDNVNIFPDRYVFLAGHMCISMYTFL